jgi:formylglycine-generating enzyme required for sulfatase activity
VRSSDAKLAGDVMGSLELFDPTAAFAARPPAPATPAPAGMVAIAASEFPMGCANESLMHKPVGELGCTEAAQPLHRVRLSAFAIDRTEVTYGEYAACVAASACTPAAYATYAQPEKQPMQPVRYVTWDQAEAF